MKFFKKIGLPAVMFFSLYPITCYSAVTTADIVDGAVTNDKISNGIGPEKLATHAGIKIVHTGAADNKDTFSSPLAAINYLNALPSNHEEKPSATKPYFIKIMPGWYDLGENTLQMLEYVDIEGSGESTTHLFSNTCRVAPLVRAASNAEMRSLTLESNIAGACNVKMLDITNTSAKISNVTIALNFKGSSYTGTGISISSTNSTDENRIKNVTIKCNELAPVEGSGICTGIDDTSQSTTHIKYTDIINTGGSSTTGIYANKTIKGMYIYNLYVVSQLGLNTVGLKSSYYTRIENSKFEMNGSGSTVGIEKTGGVTFVNNTTIFSSNIGIKSADTPPAAGVFNNQRFHLTNSQVQAQLYPIEGTTISPFPSGYLATGEGYSIYYGMFLANTRLVGNGPSLVGGSITNGITCFTSYGGFYNALDAKCIPIP